MILDEVVLKIVRILQGNLFDLYLYCFLLYCCLGNGQSNYKFPQGSSIWKAPPPVGGGVQPNVTPIENFRRESRICNICWKSFIEGPLYNYLKRPFNSTQDPTQHECHPTKIYYNGIKMSLPSVQCLFQCICESGVIHQKAFSFTHSFCQSFICLFVCSTGSV